MSHGGIHGMTMTPIRSAVLVIAAERPLGCLCAVASPGVLRGSPGCKRSFTVIARPFLGFLRHCNQNIYLVQEQVASALHTGLQWLYLTRTG